MRHAAASGGVDEKISGGGYDTRSHVELVPGWGEPQVNEQVSLIFTLIQEVLL